MTAKRWLSSWLVILLLGNLVPAQADKSAVIVGSPQKKAVRGSIDLPAFVEADQTAEISARLPGILKKIHVNIGDKVKKDQLLAEQSVPDVVANRERNVALVKQRAAEIELAQQTLEACQLRIKAAKDSSSHGQAAVLKAEAVHKLAQKDFDRASSLVTSSAISKKEFEGYRQKLTQAEADLAASKALVQKNSIPVLEAEVRVKEAQAALEVAKTRLDVARHDLKQSDVMLQFASLRSPFDGVVVVRNADAGEFVGAGASKPMLTIARIDQVRIVLAVPQADIPAIRAGTAVQFRLMDKDFKGQIARTSAYLSKRGTLRAEVDLPNPNGKLLPGMYGTVSLPVERASVWTVPSSALMDQTPESRCFLFVQGKAVLIRVKIGAHDSKVTEVIAFKKADQPAGKAGWIPTTGNETIIADWSKVSDGQPVSTRGAYP